MPAGVTPYAVCQYLDGHEIDGPDGTRLKRAAIKTANGKTWERVGVQGLLVVLRAKRNIGVREWSAKWDGGKRPAGELHNARWDGIVSRELFDAVQAQLALRHRARPGGNNPAHLLTGFAYCGNCGKRLRIHRVGGKRRYACSSWTAKGCVSFEADAAEREVERYLYKWLARNTMLAKALEHTGNADLQKLYQTRDKLEELRARLDDKLADEVIDAETYKRQKARKDKDLAEVAGEIDAILTSGAVGSRGRQSFPTGPAFRTEWNSSDLNGKRGIVRQFIDRVTIYPAGAGNKPDPRLVQIHPGSWAAGIDDAQPATAPDPVSFTSKGKIAAFLLADAEGYFTREDVAAATGLPIDAVHKNLQMLRADVSRFWRRRGGQRACFVYRAGGGTWEAQGGGDADLFGARGKVKAFLASDANSQDWFTQAEIAERSRPASAGRM